MSRITRIDIDDSAIAPATPEMEQERRVAIFDLIEDNSFVVPGRDGARLQRTGRSQSWQVTRG